MAKYSFEFKMEVVRAYLNGEGGYKCLAKKFNLPASSNVHKWVVCFQEFGEEGLLRKRKNKKYTLDFKLEVVEYYLTTEISYQNLALKFGMNNPDLITIWVSKFRKESVEGLSNPKGRPPKMKPKKEKDVTNINSDINKSDRIKELEKQVRYL